MRPGSALRAFVRTAAGDEQALLRSLKRFANTFDDADLVSAIKRSYELQLDMAKNANRLIAYRQLVTSGVPARRRREAATSATTSLLPLP